MHDSQPVYNNICFRYGTLNMDRRLDLCKQGVKNASIDSCKAVVADEVNSKDLSEHEIINIGGKISNNVGNVVRFKYGTLNGDGRLDLCKQGVKKAFTKSCKAVVIDGEVSNTRFQHGTLNSDGRLDLCKQGVKNAYSNLCTAVIEDGNNANIRFQHGTLNNDGRLDLCKQGVKKAFSTSCSAVAKDGYAAGRPLIKHYLIGNNIIGDNKDGMADNRVAALCDMISKRPDILTWYLAGNALSSGYIASVAQALTHTKARYVWLKMNPIKDGCFSLAELIQKNTNIELLDLFNCGIGDNGILSFCKTLIETGKNMLFKHSTAEDFSSINDIMTMISETQNINRNVPTEQIELLKSFQSLNMSNLKHFYLGINGITQHGCEALFCIFAILSENIESIYIHSNPLEDVGLQTIFTKMTAYGVIFPKLKRLCVGSCGLTDISLPILKKMIHLSPALVSLDLSSYKSTNYFGQTHNCFTNMGHLKDIASALKSNAIKSGFPNKNYLGFQHTLCGLNQTEIKAVVESIAEGLEVNVNGIQYKDEDVARSGMLIHKNLTKRELSEVTDPYPAIDYIQSIYRNTMKL